MDSCEKLGAKAVVSNVWGQGGEGAEELAHAVVERVDAFEGKFTPMYDLEDDIKTKVEKLATKVYGAANVEFIGKSNRDLKRIADLGLEGLPICMAKTQKSLSDNDKLIGRPTGFTLTVREIEIAAGAGFLVPITGTMMRMPGLPATPASENIDIDADGNISGLF
jgi:formate--tetrahydrofolate ligase